MRVWYPSYLSLLFYFFSHIHLYLFYAPHFAPGNGEPVTITHIRKFYLHCILHSTDFLNQKLMQLFTSLHFES